MSPARLCSFLPALMLAGCVYVPVVDHKDEANSRCETYTKSMTLEAVEVGVQMPQGCRNEECAAVLGAAIVVSAGSALISGSIVLTGNTVHWLEYHGTCSDGYLNRTKQMFLESMQRKLKPGS